MFYLAAGARWPAVSVGLLGWGRRRQKIVSKVNPQELPRVHWNQEASRCGYDFPCWRAVEFIIGCCSPPRKDTTVEAIIRGCRCHVGRNNFTGLWQVVIAIRQYCGLYGHTVLPSTAGISVAITQVGIDVMSQNATRKTKEGNCGQHGFHLALVF